MSGDDEINIRPGRIRARPAKGKSFVARVLAATQKAGGLHRSGARGKGRGGFGRGRAASLGALRGLTSKSRGAVVKARVVRHGPKAAPLAAHLSYLRRDGVTRDGAPGKMFDAAGDAADARAFAERCQGDRHHFRFIVSPDDAAELSDLRAFTRDLMAQVSRDLGTRSIGSQSIIGTPSIRISMSWRADARTMAPISSSAATISAEVFAPAPRSS